MKRKIILSLALFFIPFMVKANSIKDISMDIYVDNNGTAHVTETWTANLSEGTEGYKPYYNIGNSEFSNFKVKLENKEYTYIDNWNPSSVFSEKAYKNGINYISNGLELCFGISNYGSNKYILTYDISNFIVNLTDAQMLYWALIPYELSSKPDNVYIKIYSDFRYEKTIDVWGYGKKGVPTYVYDGYIEMTSDGQLDSNEYMTILVKFPLGSFNIEEKNDKDFNYYLDMANKGADKYKISKFIAIINSLIPLLTTFFIIFLSVFISKRAARIGTYNLKFGETGNKIKKNVLFYRDIPYKKEDITRAYWIACQYGLAKKTTDFLGAILLKWYKEKKVDIKKETVKKMMSEKEETIIIFNNCEGLSEVEIKLYQMMYEASKDGKLEKKEFEVWCKNHYSEIINWFNKVIDAETEKMIAENLITVNTQRRINYDVSPTMMLEAEKLLGLKNFLNEFSNIKDKSAIEVTLWEEYLMYAQIFGVAQKVMKEFKNLYPDVITEEVYNNIDFIYIVSYNGMTSATTARDRARSYSSGGGGFASGGGGGGSFGGGGGGGGFR